jgi:leader peptidase (prepilin peptidase) / N-methyltransferase
MHAFYIIFFFALGACVGSFLNVVVWRLPRGESLITPPSRCPVCQHPLAIYDNIPVFGWLGLRGRCRYCHTPISAEYPTVEFITGALFVLYYVLYFVIGGFGPCWTRMEEDQTFFGISHDVPYYVESISRHWPQYSLAVFTVSALLAASLIDARHFFIPQSIPILLTVVGLLYHAILDRPVGDPGALNLHNPVAAAITVGATLGLLVSLALVWTGRMARSFDKGWPPLEIEKEPPPADQPNLLTRVFGRWIAAYRRKLTPDQEATLSKFKAAADAREKEEDERQKREEDAQRAKFPPAKEYTKPMIRAEIRKEMAFLTPPMLGGILAAVLLLSLPSLRDSFAVTLRNHDWLSGLLGSLLGGLVGAFVIWLTRILGSLIAGREAMGMGDVDLMFGVGTIVGAAAATMSFFIAPFFAIGHVILMLLVGKRRELPFGPYLSLGTGFVMIAYCRIAMHLGLFALPERIREAFGH